MAVYRSQLQLLLEELAGELRRAELSVDTSPTPQQLASREPFCVDTLAFEQWLQWVFIPQLDKLLAMPDFTGLPNQSDILTMAEYAFKDYPSDTQRVCDVIRRIDEALNGFAPPVVY